jgi:hypothetical protein
VGRENHSGALRVRHLRLSKDVWEQFLSLIFYLRMMWRLHPTGRKKGVGASSPLGDAQQAPNTYHSECMGYLGMRIYLFCRYCVSVWRALDISCRDDLGVGGRDLSSPQNVMALPLHRYFVLCYVFAGQLKKV